MKKTFVRVAAVLAALVSTIILLTLTCYAAPPTARDRAIESRWNAYSLTNASVKAFRVQLNKLYPVEKRLQNQANLLYAAQGSVATTRQLETTAAQLDKVRIDINKCKQGIERIKTQFVLTIASSLPQ